MLLMKLLSIFVSSSLMLCSSALASNYGSTSVIPAENAGKILFNKMRFNDGTSIERGAADPTSSATEGGPGSLYLSTNGNVYKKNDSGTTTNWTILTAGGGYVNKTAFTIQPASTAVPGVAFTTQPTVAIQDLLGNTVTGSTATVTLAAFTASNCTTAGAGTVSNNTAAAYQGLSSFTSTSYNKSQTIYLKASNDALTAGCSSGILLNVPSGQLDITYGTSGFTSGVASVAAVPGDGTAAARAYGMAKLSDDRVVLVGSVGTPISTAGGRKWHVAMYKSDGTGLDTTFGTSGVVETFTNDLQGSQSEPSDVVVDSSDNIYVAGTYYNVSHTDWAVLKLNNAGAPVAAFGTNGQLGVAVSTVNDKARQIYVDGGTLVVAGCSRCAQISAGIAVGKFNITTGVSIINPIFTTAGSPVSPGVDLVNGAIGKLTTGEYVSATYTSALNASIRWRVMKWTNALAISGAASEVWTGTTANAGTLGFTQITDLVIDGSDHVYAVGNVNVNSALGAQGNDVSIKCFDGSTFASCASFGTGGKFNTGITSTSCPGVGPYFVIGNDLAGKAVVDGTSVAVATAELEAGGLYKMTSVRVTSAGIMDPSYNHAMCNVAGLGDVSLSSNSTTSVTSLTPYTAILGIDRNSFDGDYMFSFFGSDTASSPANVIFWNILKAGN